MQCNYHFAPSYFFLFEAHQGEQLLFAISLGSGMVSGVHSCTAGTWFNHGVCGAGARSSGSGLTGVFADITSVIR